jgi:tRNA (guanine10-N2)-dimethyltransferase
MQFFLLGSQPKLSLAELDVVTKGRLSPVFQSESILVTEPTGEPSDLLMQRLGGLIKVGHIIGEVDGYQQDEMADLIAGFAMNASGKEKIRFGISVYSADGSSVKKVVRDIHRLGVAVKKRLKETGRPVRYVQSKEPTLSSVIVTTNGLLESGGEFVLLVTKNKILVGQTDVVQDFKAWSARDYGRPGRDAKSGMLPPKLARMMINVTGVDPEGASIMDPFCGSGTVLNEAYMMGFKTLVGNDLSEKATADTTKNLTWLMSEFDLEPPKFFVFTGPAAEVPSVYDKKVDAIVTEVYLGKPRRRALDLYEAKRSSQELMPLYDESFTALKETLKPGGTAVVAFPAFKLRDDTWYRLPIKKMLKQIGYKDIQSLWYAREDQFVARDLYVFTR